MLTLYIADVERDVGMKKLSQEEAEKVLEGMKVKIEIPKAAVTQWKRNTALDMAIEALKYSEVPNSSDCISRQAAIDAIDDWWITVDDNRHPVDAIKALPPAQPEPQSDAYTKAVWTWLLDYQIKAAELKGRYTPYEVLSWVANDWRKEHEGSD